MGDPRRSGSIDSANHGDEIIKPASLLSVALAQQPEPERYAYLRRYADTATVETMTMQNERGEWMQARCVTVTVFDKSDNFKVS